MKKTLFVAVAPPAAHPRMASMLGDVAELNFSPHSAVSKPFSLSNVLAESADRAYVELPDEVDKIDSTFIPELLRCLKKGGSICVRHRAQVGGGASWGDILLYGGFVDCARREGDGVTCETEAKKPNWDANAAVPISLKKKQAQPTTSPKTWNVSADDGDDLMDEDMLLGAEDLKAKPKDVSECVASNGKKACKNCSCGLAEKLAGDEAATAAPTSACGSCYLGDAFRCEGCPHRGTPPFKPGERVVISAD